MNARQKPAKKTPVLAVVLVVVLIASGVVLWFRLQANQREYERIQEQADQQSHDMAEQAEKASKQRHEERMREFGAGTENPESP